MYNVYTVVVCKNGHNTKPPSQSTLDKMTPLLTVVAKSELNFMRGSILLSDITLKFLWNMNIVKHFKIHPRTYKNIILDLKELSKVCK